VVTSLPPARAARTSLMGADCRSGAAEKGIQGGPVFRRSHHAGCEDSRVSEAAHLRTLSGAHDPFGGGNTSGRWSERAERIMSCNESGCHKCLPGSQLIDCIARHAHTPQQWQRRIAPRWPRWRRGHGRQRCARSQPLEGCGAGSANAAAASRREATKALDRVGRSGSNDEAIKGRRCG